MAGNLFDAKTKWGADLASAAAALWSPEAGAKRAERDALVAQRTADAELKRAQIEKYRMEKDAAEAKRKQEATWLTDAVKGLMGGASPQPVMDFRAAGGTVQPQPETAEMPGIMGGYPMDRPAGYTPQIEGLINNMEGMSAFSRGLPGKTNAEQAMQAIGHKDIQAVIQQALNGQRPKEDAYIAQGKPAFDFNAQVPVGNLATGAADATSPFAVASLAKTNAEADQERALAEQQRAAAGKYSRDESPLVPVRDANSPTGFVYARRGAAVGQPAPLPGATKVADAIFEPTKPNVTEGQRVINNSADTMALISEARTLAADPRNFGASGMIRSTVQDMMQQGDALARTLGSRAAAVQQDVMSLGSDVGLENFDTKIPQLDLMTNLLAFQLAKMNDPGGRVTDQDFRIAKAKITGGSILGNQADFLSRLDLFERTLSGNVQRKQEFLGGRGQRGAITPAPTGAAPKVIQYDAQGNRLN